MSFGFNYFFEPFDTNFAEHKMDYLLIHLVHALVSLFVFIALSFGLNLFFISEENWTLKKELSFIAILLLCVGIGQFLIRDIIYDNLSNWSLNYFVEEIVNTSLVGFLFSCIIIPINQMLLFQKYADQAVLLNEKENLDLESILEAEARNDIHLEIVKEASQENVTIFIKTAIEQENFELNINRFLYAKSEGNYVEIYLSIKNHRENKLVKRITLSNFLSQFSDFPFIIQTHRSYLINLKKVKEVKGNAQGYKLKLANPTDSMIPVSRSYISIFQEKWTEFRL